MDIQNADALNPLILTHDNRTNQLLWSPVPDICKNEPCALGVDEAGRGPVLGPMVYGVCYCPVSVQEELRGLGAVDSKSIAEIQRELAFEKLCERTSDVGWAVEIISPNTISNKMLRRSKVSLNEISHNSAIALIQQAIDNGVRLTEVYVDTVGPPEKYQDKLSGIFPGIKITVAKKADATYPVVSAASICAKVCRDRAVSNWKFKEEVEITGDAWGSGYPNDPVTKKFLSENLDPVFGFPQIVRFSWSTADKILKEKCAPVEWEDVDDDGVPTGVQTIQSFFTKPAASSGSKLSHRFFTERNLNRETCLD